MKMSLRQLKEAIHVRPVQQEHFPWIRFGFLKTHLTWAEFLGRTIMTYSAQPKMLFSVAECEDV